MKFGIRVPSLRRRVAARLSVKRAIRQRLKLRVPRGYGLITNPRKAIYNRVYNRTSVSVDRLAKGSGCLGAIFLFVFVGSGIFATLLMR